MQSNTEYILCFKKPIPSRTDELYRIREVVEREAMKFGFDPETAFRLALAVDEACTNIIKHSYGGNPGQTFDLEIATAGREFVIILTDHGKGFIPPERLEMDMMNYLKQMRRGGLGLHIMKTIMDHIDYHTSTGHRHRLRMVKTLP